MGAAWGCQQQGPLQVCVCVCVCVCNVCAMCVYTRCVRVLAMCEVESAHAMEMHAMSEGGWHAMEEESLCTNDGATTVQ